MAEWSTGLQGCFDMQTESMLDPFNYTLPVNLKALEV